MKQEKVKKNLTILLFFLLYLFGVCFIKNITANFDEGIEQRILQSNIMGYSQKFGLESLTDYYKNLGVEPISENSEMDHGISPYYIFTPLLLVKNISSNYLSVLWHLYTFTIFFIGVIYIYKLANLLFKNKRVALISTMIYYLSPRILIDSFHNNKDIVLMSLLVIMIYYGIKMTIDPKFKNAIIFGIISGFVCNIKILGLYFLFILGMSYIWYNITRKKMNKRSFMVGLSAAIISCLSFLLLTPAIWTGETFKLIYYINYCLNNSVNFRGTTNVMFEGIIYNKSVNPLPWYYVPKFIIMTVPVIITILFIISLVQVIKNNICNIRNKKKNDDIFFLNTVILIMLVPLSIAILTRPNIYNGWRHFYFLYSLIMIINMYSVNHFIREKKKIVLYSFYLLCFISTIFNSYCLIQNGIKNTSYYNELMINKKIDGKYDLDYYGVTASDSIYEFMNNSNLYHNEDKINIYGNGFNYRIINNAYWYSSGNLSKKINVVTEEELDSYLESGQKVYELVNSVYHVGSNKEKKLVYDYKIFNSSITKFYLITGD